MHPLEEPTIWQSLVQRQSRSKKNCQIQNAFWQLDGQFLPGLARDSPQEEHLHRPSHLRCRAWGHVGLRKSLSWSGGWWYVVLIEHFQKVKDRRIISQKIKRKGGGNGASYSLLFRHQLCIYTFPDSDLNTLINIVDSTTPTEHHQKLLIHFIQRKKQRSFV